MRKVVRGHGDIVQDDRGYRFDAFPGGFMPIRIVIADDHAVVRQGLKMFLLDDPDFEVVAEAQNGAEALALAKELKPDVVLMDLLMPVMDGITAIGYIRREAPD